MIFQFWKIEVSWSYCERDCANVSYRLKLLTVQCSCSPLLILKRSPWRNRERSQRLKRTERTTKTNVFKQTSFTIERSTKSDLAINFNLQRVNEFALHELEFFKGALVYLLGVVSIFWCFDLGVTFSFGGNLLLNYCWKRRKGLPIGKIDMSMSIGQNFGV